MDEMTSAPPEVTVVALGPGTKLHFDHAAQRWAVRPNGSREWLPLRDNAAEAVGATDKLDKFKWYDVFGLWAACVVDGLVTDIKAAVQ